MQEDLQRKIDELESKLDGFASEIDELQSWKDQREKQQLHKPLDEVTIQLIRDAVGGDNFLKVANDTEITIASGVVTPRRTYHRIETESAASTDDLVTITTSGISSGTLLIIRASSSSHTVVAKDGTGNLDLAGDFSMDNNDDILFLIKEGSNWKEISRSNNSA